MKVSKINTMKKDELIAFINSSPDIKADGNSTRTDLLKIARGIIVENHIRDVAVEGVEKPNYILANDPRDEVTIEHTIHDLDWTDYAMGLLHPHEIIDKFPTADGLRRIFQLLVGDILASEVTPVQTPDNENGGRATVLCRITYQLNGKHGYGSVGGIRNISDVSDCYYGNTVDPYYKHASATAATMAEGRCLRKALRMKTLVKEEVQGPEGVDADIANDLERSQQPATDNQKNIIQRISDRINVDVEKVIKDTAGIGATNLDSLTHREALTVTSQLVGYQRGPTNGGKAIPEHLYKNSTVKTDAQA